MQKLLKVLFVGAVLFVSWIVFSMLFDYIFGFRPIELLIGR